MRTSPRSSRRCARQNRPRRTARTWSSSSRPFPASSWWSSRRRCRNSSHLDHLSPFPLPLGEIGDFLRFPSFHQGLSGERDDGTPRGGVVAVDGRGSAATNRLEELAHREKIDSAV